TSGRMRSGRICGRGAASGKRRRKASRTGLRGAAHEDATPAVAVNALIVPALDDGPAEEREFLLHVLVASALRRPSLVRPGLPFAAPLAEPAIHDDGDVLAPAKPVLEIPGAIGVVTGHDEQQHQRSPVGPGPVRPRRDITVAAYRAAPRFPKEFVPR